MVNFPHDVRITSPFFMVKPPLYPDILEDHHSTCLDVAVFMVYGRLWWDWLIKFIPFTRSPRGPSGPSGTKWDQGTEVEVELVEELLLELLLVLVLVIVVELLLVEVLPK